MLFTHLHRLILSVTERSFLRVPIKQYIYPVSLQNLSEASQHKFLASLF